MGFKDMVEGNSSELGKRTVAVTLDPGTVEKIKGLVSKFRAAGQVSNMSKVIAGMVEDSLTEI